MFETWPTTVKFESLKDRLKNSGLLSVDKRKRRFFDYKQLQYKSWAGHKIRNPDPLEFSERV